MVACKWAYVFEDSRKMSLRLGLSRKYFMDNECFSVDVALKLIQLGIYN